jgi:3-deoxy-7-phosphoheptulonate synthase
MVVVMQEGAGETQIQAVIDRLVSLGFDIHRSTGVRHTLLGAVGGKTGVDPRDLELLEGVNEVLRISTPYKLAGRTFRPEGTVVNVGGVLIGGKNVPLLAGPCSVESEEQMEAIASGLAAEGVRLLRGGAFKPRTSPYSFQGLGEEGLRIMRQVADRHGMKVVSEVMDHTEIPMMLNYVDMLQVGARNMQNYILLKELGKVTRPILLKRGPSATIEELLLSAEYILSGGNREVVLCERGIRTFENYTRNTLDVSAIPVIQKLSHLPIVADPSHGTGLRDKVSPMARASLAAGADGLMIEVHHQPEKALSDGAQALTLPMFQKLMKELRLIAVAVEREVS